MPGVPQLLRGGRGAGGSLHHCMVHTGMLEAWMDARALKTNGPAAWVGAKRKERQKLLAVPGVPQPLHGLNTRVSKPSVHTVPASILGLQACESPRPSRDAR